MFLLYCDKKTTTTKKHFHKESPFIWFWSHLSHRKAGWMRQCVHMSKPRSREVKEGIQMTRQDHTMPSSLKKSFHLFGNHISFCCHHWLFLIPLQIQYACFSSRVPDKDSWQGLLVSPDHSSFLLSFSSQLRARRAAATGKWECKGQKVEVEAGNGKVKGTGNIKTI